MPTPALSDRLKQLRVDAGLSQQALATAAGLSISLVAALEQGAKADPRLSTLRALAKALGVHVGELIGEAGAGRRARSTAAAGK